MPSVTVLAEVTRLEAIVNTSVQPPVCAVSSGFWTIQVRLLCTVSYVEIISVPYGPCTAT